MFEVESLKSYIDKVSEDAFLELATNIYAITSFICECYPKHKEWFFCKQLPGILEGKRDILFVRSLENQDEIIAMICLKKELEERKICSLYVLDKWRGLGIGSSIVETALAWLGTTKPFLTFPEVKLEELMPFIKKYNWELTKVESGVYSEFSNELCFNGSKPDEDLTRVELQTKLINIIKKI